MPHEDGLPLMNERERSFSYARRLFSLYHSICTCNCLRQMSHTRKPNPSFPRNGCISPGRVGKSVPWD